MLWLIKWLIFGHLHSWEVEERVTTKVTEQPSGKVVSREQIAYERCRCGAYRSRRVF